MIKTLDSAAQYGWKVKLVYHQTAGFNWFHNRGQTNHFINEVQVLEKNFTNNFTKSEPKVTGKVIDTIYVVIDRTK